MLVRISKGGFQMKNFNDTARGIAEDAVRYAMQSEIALDYTRESARHVDTFLDAFHDSQIGRAHV